MIGLTSDSFYDVHVTDVYLPVKMYYIGDTVIIYAMMFTTSTSHPWLPIWHFNNFAKA